MKILLLSAYDAQSHRHWRAALQRIFPHAVWEVLTLPPRYFSWRIRGNPLSWLAHPSLSDELSHSYNLIIATSMVDLATLKGLNPGLAAVPSVLYFHENQFSYPVAKGQSQRLEPQMVSLYAALSANRLCFNSAFNRDTFFAGVAQLLKKLPDHVPSGVVDQLKKKSQVLPVPLMVKNVDRTETQKFGSTQILWNHRWEYDKGPERLLRGLEALPSCHTVTVHVVGQSFRSSPPEFAQLHALLTARGWLGRWGYLEDEEEYQQLLCCCDIVISTALHDFQGLSILEAVAAGCFPLLPRRLAYGEFFDMNQCGYDAFEHDVSAEAVAFATRLSQLIEVQSRRAPDISWLSTQRLGCKYRELVDAVVG